jgi:iron complex transport system substrate-binding protein
MRCNVRRLLPSRNVIPAKAGIQAMGLLASIVSLLQTVWIPAFAGMTVMSATAQSAAPDTMRDDRGRELSLVVPPTRIISLLPSLTESICALGACAKLVGTDRYSNAPASVVALPKLGGLDDAQVERIVALKPDVVLASPSTRMVGRLESLGLKVMVLESRSHADVKRSLQQLATMLGTPQAAQQVWSQIERDVKEAQAKVPAALRGQRVYFEVAATPYAAGESSFIGETLTLLGMRNAVPAELGPFPKLNPEFVVRAQPDVIMAASRSLAEMPMRPGWGTLRALQQQRSCGFDAERYEVLIRPGPRLGEAAGVLAQCLLSLEPRL